MSWCRRFVGLVLLIWLACAGCAWAADEDVTPLPVADLGSPAFTPYTLRDGLPATVMGSATVDAQGYTWAASANGILRFNGRDWRTEPPAAIQGILGELFTDHEGTTWVAFRDRGVARWSGEQWVFEKGLPTQTMRRISETVDAEGRWSLWAMTIGAGLWQRVDGHWQEAPGNDGLPRGPLSIAATQTLLGGERLWLGSGEEGLWYRDRGQAWQHFTAPGFDVAQVESMQVTRFQGREQLWISTFGRGLWRLDDQGLRSWTYERGELPTNSLYAMVQSQLPNGEPVIWVASRAGLLRVHGDGVRVFGRDDGLPSTVVRNLTLWRSPGGAQVLWLSTEAGMASALADVTPWTTASHLGAQDAGVFAVRVEAHDGAERLWVGARQAGLALYEKGRWREFGPAEGLPSTAVGVIEPIVDSGDRPHLWLGLARGALARVLDGPRFELLPTPWPESDAQAVMDLLSVPTANGVEVWAGTRTSGLYRQAKGVWQPVAPVGAPVEWRVSAMARQVDEQGRSWLWASSSLGLLRHDGQKLEVVLSPEALGDRGLIGVNLETRSDRTVLWLGSTHGLIRLDVTDPSQPRSLPDDLPAPPDPFIYDAVVDSAGRIYVCTNNGVQLLTPSAEGYQSQVYSRRDGLPHEECNTNARFLDRHDRYWTGTLGGLGVHDPAIVLADREAKPLRIAGVWSDATALDPKHLVLQPGQRDLRVQFALLSWVNTDQSEFRSQLLGDEDKPTAWSRQNERSFSHLPPGHYRLRVEGRDHAGNLSTPVELTIDVQPAWWQTLLARAGFVLAAALALYLLLRWRMHASRMARRRLELLVYTRTAELREANARLIDLSNHDPLTGLANRRLLFQVLDEAVACGDEATWSAIFVDVDHFKDYNDQFGHAAGDEALRVLADVMKACAPDDALIARYGGEEFACLLRHTRSGQARVIAESMREAIMARECTVPDSPDVHRISISAGVSERVLTSTDGYHQLLRDADCALYAAKISGRNRVRVAMPLAK